MTTLLSELVRVLSQAACNELRARADGPTLSRAEMMALATLNELAAGYLTQTSQGYPTAAPWDWAGFEATSAFDLAVIARVKQPRSPDPLPVAT